MEDGSRDLKKKLLIHEDESGLELSLGLSLGGGGGGGGSSLEKKSSSLAAAAAAATVTGDGDSSAHEEEWISRTNNHSSQELWLRKAMIQQQQQQQSQQQSRLREFLAATATPSSSSPDVSSQQQQQQIAAAHVAAAAWRQMNHVDPAAKFMSSSGMPLSMGDLAKFLAAAKSTSSSSALAGHQPQQQQQQQQQQAQPREDDDELDSVEQQRKFFQQQEARKKRKMLIDEQKQNKKAKDDDKPDGAENAAGGLSHMQRATSLGTFQNQAGPSAMAALATQLMRRTISDSSLVAQAQASSRDDGNPAAAAAAQADPATEATARALDPNATADETKQLLGMWQLGTTVDMPAAESIDPELSSLRPGTVAGQIGGTGSSPDLPWVSASGPGGKAISGVAYKLFQGQYKIVCSCHGLHMSPSDFVKHAESPDASSANGGGVKGLGDSMPVLSQVTPA